MVFQVTQQIEEFNAQLRLVVGSLFFRQLVLSRDII